MSNSYANNNNKKQNSGGNVKSDEVHVVVFGNFTAKNKNIMVANDPTVTATQEMPPPTLGMKAPTTNDPNKIFAPSSRKLEIVLSWSLDNIPLNYNNTSSIVNKIARTLSTKPSFTYPHIP